jgi:hypothetical protein
MSLKSFFAIAVLALSAFALQAQTAETPKSCCAGATAANAQCSKMTTASATKPTTVHAANRAVEPLDLLSTTKSISASKSKTCDPTHCEPAACNMGTTSATASTKKSTKAKRVS